MIIKSNISIWKDIALLIPMYVLLFLICILTYKNKHLSSYDVLELILSVFYCVEKTCD